MRAAFGPGCFRRLRRREPDQVPLRAARRRGFAAWLRRTAGALTGPGPANEAKQPLHRVCAERALARKDYSHSMVEGGFDEMSSATRLTAGISLMIRLEIVSSRS